MKEIHLISQLFLENGILKSKVGRSTKKVHYRQGELDGACGAYSIAMALNIIGAFDADYLNKETIDVDFRTREGKLHKAIHDWGLFPNGLDSHECGTILDKFKKKTDYEIINATNINSELLKSYIDNDIPLMLTISYPRGAHWVVVVGYEAKQGVVQNFYILDPGSELPSSAYWNGVLSMKQAAKKYYRYAYNATDWDSMVAIETAIAIWLKK